MKAFLSHPDAYQGPESGSAPATRRDSPRLLGESAGQLNDWRVYDRDLPALARALEPVLAADRRRAPHRRSPPALTPSLQFFFSNHRSRTTLQLAKADAPGAYGWGPTGDVLKAALPRLYGSRHAATRD